jgi:hypothetical protein
MLDGNCDGGMMDGSGYGVYAARENDDHEVALGIAIVSVIVAFVSMTTPFLLFLAAGLLGFGSAPLIITLAVTLAFAMPLLWSVLVVLGVRKIGARGLWLFIAAPMALAPFWFPTIPGLCSHVLCTYVKIGPFQNAPMPSQPVYSPPPRQEATPALAAL